MKRVSLLPVISSGAFAHFLIAPPFFSKQFSSYRLMKTGDVVDVAITPVITFLSGGAG
ncbi:MAG: hypothetical protein HYU83_01610 [Chloroflexi bacterium]|nr:hypothetical protein [Chloroflexota bacterium]